MKAHKYTARTSRDALRKVREDLGPDAVILANRMVRGGVEILALSAAEMGPLAEPAPARQVVERVEPLEVGEADVVSPARILPWAMSRISIPPAVLRRRAAAEQDAGSAAPVFGSGRAFPAAPAAVAEQAPATLSDAQLAPQLARLAAAHDPQLAALASEVKALGGMLNPAAVRPQEVRAVEDSARPSVEGGPANDDWMRNMMGELRSMRLLIEDQMGAMAFADGGRAAPGKLRAARLLSSAGFSAPLIRKVTARLPDRVSEADALAFLRSALAANLAVAGDEAELLDQGGVFALVGPTGAGKTTTAAKLAARFVVRHGAENLALLTTDGYRIGGQEQLRIYGKILGVAVYAVKDAEDLKRTLAELRNRKLVLIDTVGLSQRDRMVGEQLEMFAGCGVPVKRLLLLNATCHGDTLNDVVRAYTGSGLAGCILSKLDEAVTLGAALDAAIRQRLRVFYAADGQRVPEDLHLAEARKLIERALHGVSEQPAYGALDLDFSFEGTAAPIATGAHQAISAGGVAHG